MNLRGKQNTNATRVSTLRPYENPSRKFPLRLRTPRLRPARESHSFRSRAAVRFKFREARPPCVTAASFRKSTRPQLAAGGQIFAALAAGGQIFLRHVSAHAASPAHSRRVITHTHTRPTLLHHPIPQHVLNATPS